MADHPINDYYVITSRRGEHPERWGWAICRKSKPLGIKMAGDGFQSDTAAHFAGKQALTEFLIKLSKEEKRSRKALHPNLDCDHALQTSQQLQRSERL
jgi:hypothetical protein